MESIFNIITVYFVNFTMIPGGIQLNLGYPVLVGLAFIGLGIIKKGFGKRHG